MARGATFPRGVGPNGIGAPNFNVGGFMASWAARNQYYATLIELASPHTANVNSFQSSPYRDFHIPSNVGVEQSGIVQSGGYYNFNGPGSRVRASPNYAAKDAGLTYLGFRKREKADNNISFAAGVFSGGRIGAIIPGGAYSAVWNNKTKRFTPSALSEFLRKVGRGGISNPNTRPRYMGGSIKDSSRGWKSVLTESTGPNKGVGGWGQSSIDSTTEKYATRETAAGANVYASDEVQKGKKFERDWAGWADLGPVPSNPDYLPSASNMYMEDKTPAGGDARRVNTNHFIL